MTNSTTNQELVPAAPYSDETNPVLQHVHALRSVLAEIVLGASEESPQVLAYRALQISVPPHSGFAPRGIPVYQGHRGVIISGGSRWEDLTKAQFDEWNDKGFETRILLADPMGAPPAVDVDNVPTSDELRIDWCVRTLEGVKEGGRAQLGAAYPEILQVIGALRRVLEPGLDSGPEEGEIVAPPPAAPANVDSPGPCNLTERKTAEIIATRGFRKVGYILANDAGDMCLSAQSAVRWIPQPHYWRLMHAQDGSLFYRPRADVLSRDAFEAWDDAGPLRGSRRVWTGEGYTNPAIQSDWRAWSAGIDYYIAVQAAAHAAVPLISPPAAAINGAIFV